MADDEVACASCDRCEFVQQPRPKRRADGRPSSLTTTAGHQSQLNLQRCSACKSIYCKPQCRPLPRALIPVRGADCSTTCSELGWPSHRRICTLLRRASLGHIPDASHLSNSVDALYPLCLSSLHAFLRLFGEELITAIQHAYRLTTPRPLHSTHVVHTTLAFDSRPTSAAQRLSWIDAELITHAEMGAWLEAWGDTVDSEGTDWKPVEKFTRRLGQEYIQGIVADPPVREECVVVPFVLTGLARGKGRRGVAESLISEAGIEPEGGG